MSSDQQSKSLLEIVLMPLVLAVLGVMGTLVITIVERENTKALSDAEVSRAERAAETERTRAQNEFRTNMQVKLLEIFGERVASQNVNDRKQAILLLRVVDPEFAQQLTSAYLSTETTDPEVRSLAESELQRRIQLDIATVPKAVRPGEKTSITIVARDISGKALSGVTVNLSAGGGKFLEENEQYDPASRLHGPYSATGQTNATGQFKTYWVCNPCAAGYGLVAEAQKYDFTPAKKEFSVSINQ